MPANGCPSNIDPAEYERIQARLHPWMRDHGIAMPSDPKVPLTKEQMAWFLSGDRRALIEIARLAMPEPASQPITEIEVSAHAGSNGAQRGI